MRLLNEGTIEYNTNFTFAYISHPQAALGEHGKLHLAEPRLTEAHKYACARTSVHRGCNGLHPAPKPTRFCTAWDFVKI